MSWNLFVCTGRLTNQPAQGQTQRGSTFARFGVAVGQSYKNQNGDYDTDFFNFTAYGNTANYLIERCGKGDLVSVTAELHNSEYDDQNGTHVRTVQGTVQNLHIIMHSRSNQGYQESTNQVGQRQPYQPSQQTRQQQPTQPRQQAPQGNSQPPQGNNQQQSLDMSQGNSWNQTGAGQRIQDLNNSKPVEINDDALPFNSDSNKQADDAQQESMDNLPF